MKLLLATGIFPPDIGGPAIYTKKLAEYYANQGVEITVVTYGSPVIEKFPYKVISVSRVLPEGIRQLVYCFRLFQESISARGILAFDSLGAGLPAVICGIILRKKVVIRMGGDFLWEKYIENTGELITLREFYARRKENFFPILFRLIKWTLNHSSCVAFTTIMQRDLFVRYYRLTKPEIVLVENMLQKEESEMSGSIDKNTLLWAGRFLKLKNLLFLIDVFSDLYKNHPNLKLKLIGDGPEKESVIKYISQKGLSTAILIHSGISGREIGQEIAKSRLCVLPSLSEVSPNFALQCISSGTPVILSSETGIKDSFPELIYANPLDRKDFMDKINSLLDENNYGKYFSEIRSINRWRDCAEVAEEFKGLFQPKDLKVLSIGSDRNLFVDGSEAQERIKEYGKLFNELHVIVFADKNLGLSDLKLDDNIFIYPTNYSYKFLYLFSAYKIIKHIIHNSSFIIHNSVISCQDPFESGLVGWLLKLRYKLPLQLQVHTDIFSPYFAKESLLNRLRVLLAKFLLPRADSIRVVSKRIKQSLKANSLKLKAEPTVLPILVDVKKIQSAEVKVDLHKKYPEYDFIILMASRLTKEKNISMAIRAMEKACHMSHVTCHMLLLIVGDGPELSDLKAKSSKLKADVVFEPWTDDLTSYYKTADLFLLTSNYEGYGRTVVEAIAAGLPVVMTDVGLAGEVLIDDLDGKVVSVGDEKSLATAILELKENPVKRGEFKQNSLKLLEKWPDKKEYLEKYKNLLLDVTMYK